MDSSKIAAGQRQSWRLLEKIGEGDAGEVYLVESLVGMERAILKRPGRNAMAGDQMRQAAQIKNEGKALKILEDLTISGEGYRAHIPTLIDQDLLKTPYSAEVFIVLEAATGIDLRTLARTAQFGLPEEIQEGQRVFSSTEQRFLEHVQAKKTIPELVVLRSLAGLFDLLAKTHARDTVIDGRRCAGILWNDVKPEHLFWDPVRETLTVIDWGNVQFLEEDGGSFDRRFSRRDDVIQFLQEMGRFLEEYIPGLHQQLGWHTTSTTGVTSFGDLQGLRQQITGTLNSGLEQLRSTRRQEGDLAFKAGLGPEALEKLAGIQDCLLDLGEYPDPQTIDLLHDRLAIQLANEGRLEEFLQVCQSALSLPENQTKDNKNRWNLQEEFARIASNTAPGEREIALTALKFGVNGDWPSALWALLPTIQSGSLPDWWESLSRLVRQVHLGVEQDILLPYVAVSRAYYTLQAMVMKNGDRSRIIHTAGPSANQKNSPYGALLKALEAEVLQKWKDPEPDPPFAGVEYTDIESLYNDIDSAMPGMRDSIDQALEPAREQANSVMEAWRQKDFDKARRSLRMLMLSDPQRRRILQADRDIASAGRWLARVRSGARKGEAYLDYITQVELEGRELRNHVGSAPWLDMILEAFKQLRNQARPADLLIAQPELLTAAPWLNEYRAQETISLPHSTPLSLERNHKHDPDTQPLMGMHHSRLGPGEEISLTDPADVWAPEAIGSSARVFNAEILTPTGKLKTCVLKILRPDKAEYALPLFQEEAKILTILKDVDGANRLLECGFIKLNSGSVLPAENQRKGADLLQANIQRFGINEVQSYLSSLEKMTADGWLPYLALEKLDPKHNLMLFCDYGHTRGRFLPLRDSLVLAIQICDILQIAHDRNIAYRDHKILHYYWDERSQAVTMIDWNIAKRYPQGLSPMDRQFDIVQFGARALHHILTGRAAPGSLPMGANLVQEIEQAAHTYQTQWTYDDERLPQQVKAILGRVLLEGYTNIRELRQDLLQVFMQIPEQQA